MLYRTSHDVTEDGLTVTIAMALEEATGVPAAETIADFPAYADPDALCRLFRTDPEGEARPGAVVELTIEGHDVRIGSDGEIEIRGPDET